MKKVALILEFDSCDECPYHYGGESLGSHMHCEFFVPPRQIFDSNDHNCKFEDGRRIAKFCELPEDEIFRYES